MRSNPSNKAFAFIAALALSTGVTATSYAIGPSGQNQRNATGPDSSALKQVLDLNRRLVDAENEKNFNAVKRLVWNSPSALFVAKTATAAEGNWVCFWEHDVVVQHLHDVIFGGPFHIDPDYAKAKAVLLSRDVAETYVPVQITVGYGGQQAVPKPFLILIDWVKVSGQWRMASDIAIPVPPPASA